MSWQNKILRVDLGSGEITTEPLNWQWANEYLGGRGLASKYLSEEMDASADAESPENALIFGTGPLTGTMASTSGRYVVVTKGPLTGAIACSNSGGKFGAELKYAGYDMLIIRGRAKSPVYLHIHNDRAELLPADEIWGKTVWQADEWLHRRHQDPQLKVAAIGAAGEQGVKYACVVNDLHRAAGRSGVGAVMGSKNLKAIAARGSVGLKEDDPVRVMKAAGECNAALHGSRSRRGLMRYGTLAMMDNMQEFGGLPTENFRKVSFGGVGAINAKAVVKKNRNGHVNLVTNAACFGCTIACGRIAKIDPAHFSVRDRREYWGASGGLEYETAFAFGPVVGVDDLDALTFAGFMMNEHGMDPISFGVTLAAAMELYEEGVLTKEQTGGIDLSFGSAEALVALSEMTGKCEGFGRELGLGSKRLCEKYGRPELAMVSKGQEFAGYDGRAMQGMGLGYATSNRGACHLRHDTFAEDMKDPGAKGKAEACRVSQDMTAMIDSTGLCLFTSNTWGAADYCKLVDAACPGDWSEERLRETGERIWNLERMFNLKAGLTRKDDSLPPRMLKDPLPSGFAKGGVNELEVLLPEYYQLRGWDANGVPGAEKLRALGLAA
ncbi:MAG: aldehyde ferredoxin oxidoreductase family protein [Gammaproteobacteria bacterium]|nr:aldehyde ferredoxin oxidoreductase family protein [Gammaproteobacteria bacterium]CAJ2376715.1 MAG: Tungsten-containing aldehyde ferredoxin oxidoreductase [Arenicellales bacterium IbO2]MDA7962135.1 aldehyde ferredoxin oxidoreductase family protein [Gammaproteobacteria bacterium]MDA7970463.1 aldehyde ferredoxin oxidoreductase family protein [Gammaproteobacteria bacterium]MDA7995306.1 aldehyde ferredoxin oxidoreductase family protein [Gammaproteobacteria bacterium]